MKKYYISAIAIQSLTFKLKRRRSVLVEKVPVERKGVRTLRCDKSGPLLMVEGLHLHL